jgi:hypothetical protein
MDRPCTLQEVKDILLSFSTDKSPGPDGWTVEFFLHYFDLVGVELLDLVEDSRLRGKVTGSLNSTYLTLILKENNPTRPLEITDLSHSVICVIN